MTLVVARKHAFIHGRVSTINLSPNIMMIVNKMHVIQTVYDNMRINGEKNTINESRKRNLEKYQVRGFVKSLENLKILFFF